MAEAVEEVSEFRKEKGVKEEGEKGDEGKMTEGLE